MDHDSIRFNFDGEHRYDIKFNLKDQLILNHETIIWTYSAQDKSWACEENYEIPEDYKLISVSKYDKLYLLLDNYICERSDPKTPAKIIFAGPTNVI